MKPDRLDHFKFFDEMEVEAISREMVAIDLIDRETQKIALDEFARSYAKCKIDKRRLFSSFRDLRGSARPLCQEALSARWLPRWILKL